jgi:signal transduction histidine kinase
VGRARPRSLRVRTTAAATLTLLPLLAVAGATGVVVQRHQLTDGVAQVATEQARGVVREVTTGDTPELDHGEDAVQVVRGGAVVATTGPSAPLVPAPSGTVPVTGSVDGGRLGESDPYLSVALAADASTYVVVARSLESVDAATASTTTLLVAGGLLVLVAVGALTWVTTGRALSPVEAMRARAASIPADQLDRRLPVPGTGDEVARLATTLNELLDRIDAATRAQRQFVADASHELRSPVATIRALVETDRVSPHPGGPDGLAAEVLAETAHLGGLVATLLALARGDTREPLPHGRIDLSAVVRAEAHRHRRVEVTASVEDGLSVPGDEDALSRMLRNLLDNAEQHGAGPVHVTARLDGDRVELVVTDSGPGIPAAERDRVFERFVRLDAARSAGGAGLGLALVRQTATRHGGDVTAHESATGARLVVRLPGGRA